MAGFGEVADPVVVAVQIVNISNTITVSICPDNWTKGEGFVLSSTKVFS